MYNQGGKLVSGLYKLVCELQRELCLITRGDTYRDTVDGWDTTTKTSFFLSVEELNDQLSDIF